MSDEVAIAKAAAARIIAVADGSRRGVAVYATDALLPHMAMMLDRRARIVPSRVVDAKPWTVRTIYCGRGVWTWLALATGPAAGSA